MKQIRSIKRLEETTIRFGGNGDNWHMTWAKDDKQYASLCDGIGWPGMPQAFYNSRLIATAGNPPDVKFEFLTNYPELINRRENREMNRYYNFAVLALDDYLYQFLSTPNRPFDEPQPCFAGAKLIYSPDLGRTWHNQDGSTPVRWEPWEERSKANMAFFEEDGEAFSLLTILQMGKNYEYNTDGYVYIYSSDGPSAYESYDQMVLARVPADRVGERGAYEFLAGVGQDGTPAWSADIARRQRVFRYPGHCQRSDVVYVPGLKRYLMALGFDHGGAWGLFDAPQPWGPWTTVFHTADWGLGDTHGYRLPAKWVSDDGVTLCLVFSGRTHEGTEYDAFCVRRMSLQLFPPAEEIGAP